jgi:uncharacterized protein YerC
MQNYLTGYLQVLPEYQRKQIENILKDNNSLYNIQDVSEQEFSQMMKQLAVDHQPLTINTPQTDKLDADLYNSFFSSVYMDLNMLFLENHLIESATTNYDRIFEGIISDLNNEINALRERVDSLKLLNQGEDGLIVEKRSFESITEMEDPTKFSSLFVDRDGSSAVPVAFERVHDQYFCALSKTYTTDALHNDQGVTTATIAITDRRGTPITVNNQDRYKLENAIDGSTDTYWAEVVLVTDPINIDMNKA